MSRSGSQPTIFGMFQKQEAKLVRMDSGERAELGAKVKGKADSAQRSRWETHFGRRLHFDSCAGPLIFPVQISAP